jgi:hypothetical protein
LSPRIFYAKLALMLRVVNAKSTSNCSGVVVGSGAFSHGLFSLALSAHGFAIDSKDRATYPEKAGNILT